MEPPGSNTFGFIPPISVNSEQQFFQHQKRVAKVKHKILESYLGAWLAMLSQNKYRFGPAGYSKLVFVDGFAGPGIYNDNEDGSPAIAYKLALTHKNLPLDGPEIFLVFVEKDPSDCYLLFNNLLTLKRGNASAKNANKVKFMVIQGEFVNAMDWIISKNFWFPTEWEQNIFLVPSETPPVSGHPFITITTPLLVFADPFGFSGEIIPMETMGKIVRATSKAEILVNLMTGFVRRFFTLDSRAKAISLLVGLDGNDWKPVVLAEENTLGGLKKFLELYDAEISRLCPGKTFSNLFWMRDERNILIYNLYFVTQNPEGFKEMKTKMQRVSQSEITFRFSAFEAKKPDSFIETVALEDLEYDIKTYFKGQRVLGKQISDYINYETVNLYQKYKWNLKVQLEKYCVSQNKCKNQPFDAMEYLFPNTSSNDTKF